MIYFIFALDSFFVVRYAIKQSGGLLSVKEGKNVF